MRPLPFSPPHLISAWRLLLGFWLASVATNLSSAATLEAITFHAEPGKLFVPVEEAAQALRWRVKRDEAGKVVKLNDVDLAAGSLRSLVGGTELLSSLDLNRLGAEVAQPWVDGSILVGRGWRSFVLTPAAQRVEVDLAKQQLRGWQGGRLVLETRISSGRNGRTPAGHFRAGPFRSRMHYSSRYHNAPMPWSVQISGHVFIHGFTIVPSYPASHGCIRVPLTEGNPAKFFYEWVQTGAPVKVSK